MVWILPVFGALVNSVLEGFAMSIHGEFVGQSLVNVWLQPTRVRTYTI